MAIFIGGLSLDGYCISWHRFYIRFPCACGGVKYLATVPILVAKLRIGHTCQCEKSQNNTEHRFGEKL